MAQKYLVQLIDDLDGTELEEGNGEQVTFGLDGVAYLIDLSTTNADTFRDALRPYIDVARRADTAARATGGSRAGSGEQKSATPKRSDLDQVRAWANENDRPVSNRGRIPAAILDAYDAAH